jgi:hypothetical protein
VHTSKGSFAIDRGIVGVSDDLGESYGWLRVTSGLSLARIDAVIIGVTSTAVLLEPRP